MQSRESAVGSPVVVLLIESDSNLAERVLQELAGAGPKFVVRPVETQEACQEALRHDTFDVVVTGYRLAGWTALEVLEMVAEAKVDLPVVVFTSPISEDVAVACMRAGASDYVLADQLGVLPQAVQRAVAMARDRAARRLALATVEQLSAAIEQADETVVVLDARGRLVSVNRTFERCSGWLRNELVGRRACELEADSDRYEEAWADVSAGKVWRGRLASRRRDGSTWQQLLTVTPVFGEGGRIGGYVAVGRDLERELEMERQLARAAQLEAIGRLAGGVAHDMNNILGVIGGYAELVTSGLAEDDPVRADLAEITGAVERGANLTRQLLVFGRRVRTPAEALDLSAAVRDLMKFLRHVLGEDLVVRLELAEGLPKVWADRARIDQIVTNLALNAKEAMGGRGALAVTTSREAIRSVPAGAVGAAEKGEFVRLRLADRGPGIAPEVLARLFEPFSTTKSPAKGVGLGLATVYGAVADLGGFVAVESEAGFGSTFDVYLPLADSEGQKAIAPTVSSPAPGFFDPPIVLVVEDSEGIRAVVRTLLVRLGYRVLMANDAEEALRIVAASDVRVDLLVSDIVLPGENGLELADRMGAMMPTLRVVLMSGYSAEALASVGPRVEQLDILSKPFTLAALQARVAAAIAGPAWSAGR